MPVQWIIDKNDLPTGHKNLIFPAGFFLYKARPHNGPGPFFNL